MDTMFERPGFSHPLLPQALQAQYRDLGYWEGRVLYEFVREWAIEDPERLAIVGDVTITYGDLWNRSRSLAAELQRRGYGTGDYLLAVLPTSWQGVVLEVAASIVGLVLAPRSPRISPALARNLYTQLGSRGLVLDNKLATAEAWQAAITELGIESRSLLLSAPVDELARNDDLTTLSQIGSEPDFPTPDPTAPCIVLSTGGTTGVPKSILHGSEGVVYASRQFAKATGFTDQDTHVAIAPYGHAGGSVFEIYMPLMHGARILPVPRWDPRHVAAEIERWQGTFFISMGTHIYDLLTLDPADRHRLGSMRVATSGAGPDSLFERGERELGFPLVRVYGFSEAPGHAIGNLTDPPEVRLRRDGVPFPGIEHRFAAPHIHDSRFGAAGSYQCRGPNLFMGYVGQPELTHEAVTEDGFYSPSDLIGFDDRSYLTWLGRTKDIIRRGGLQIDPIELENLIATHPAMGEVVVVGVPDVRLGERAAIVAVGAATRTAPTLTELCDFLADRGIPKQNLPEFLVWVPDLARTELGKVNRAMVKQHLAADETGTPARISSQGPPATSH